MTSPVDICNRALSEIAARATLSSLSDPRSQGYQAELWYNTMRRKILRTAPWGPVRKTAQLNLLGQLTAVPPTSPWPWQFKYTYPSDCVKVRYLLPAPPPPSPNVAPTVGQPLYWAPWAMPSRTCRFLVANDDSTGTSTKVLLSNLPNAWCVYNKDEHNLDVWDDIMQDALVASLAVKFTNPLTGNIGLKKTQMEICEAIITEARIADGNEAIPETDSTPDWIAVRGQGSPFGFGPGFQTDGNGYWTEGWDSMSWGA